MHDPHGLDATGSSTSVEHQRLPHANHGISPRITDYPIFSSSLPVTRFGCSIGARSSCIFAVAEAEQVPLVGSQLGRVCVRDKSIQYLLYICMVLQSSDIQRKYRLLKPTAIELKHAVQCKEKEKEKKQKG